MPGPLPGGVWPEPTKQVVALPLARIDRTLDLSGVLLLGINSRLQLDHPYRDFLTLVSGQFASAVATLQPVDRERRAAQAKEVLIGELQHRTRNLLAVVRSISERTRAVSSSLDDYAVEFNGRLEVLSRVQGLLSRGDAAFVAIAELVRMELDALGAEPDGRIVVDGPAVDLPEASVQILALAFHELATNALKYGALVRSEGHLAVTWRVLNAEGERRLVLEWLEGGILLPAGKPSPTRSTYGSRH